MTIGERIEQLERQISTLQSSFIQAQKNQVPITSKTDNSYNKIPQVDENTKGVEENNLGLLDIAEISDENNSAIEDIASLADENNSAIEDLADLIDNLEERVTALEEKEEQ